MKKNIQINIVNKTTSPKIQKLTLIVKNYGYK